MKKICLVVILFKGWVHPKASQNFAGTESWIQNAEYIKNCKAENDHKLESTKYTILIY